MKNAIPVGLDDQQWNAIIHGLASNSFTVNDYRKVLNLLQSYQNGKYSIVTLTKEGGEEYFSYLDQRVQEGTLSANTVHRYKATLRSIGFKMQKNPSVFPQYKNPFQNAIKDDIRKKTEYHPSLFPKPEYIRAIRKIVPELSVDEQCLLGLVLNLGLTPIQIEKCLVSDFTNSKEHPDTELCFTYDAGTFQEENQKDPLTSPYRTKGYPVTYVRSSRIHAVTWQYQATFHFFDSFSKLCKEYNPALGSSDDARPFFMTTKHFPFTYHAFHDLVRKCCKKAGLPLTAVTPSQLSLYGTVFSYTLHNLLQEHAQYDQQLQTTTNPEKITLIKQAIQKNESIFLPLAAMGWIGTWEDGYPIPKSKQMDEIKKKVSDDFLLQVLR